MLNIEFTPDQIEALRYYRFHHPHPHVQLKMEVLYLRSQGLANQEIIRLCNISKASLHRYLQEYITGGIEKLKELNLRRQQSELCAHRATIEGYFRQHPPATIAEACVRIEALTGIARKPTQVRQFLKTLGMKPLKVGQIPAKADVAAQEEFKKKSWSHV